jgi:hypothetical protein
VPLDGEVTAAKFRAPPEPLQNNPILEASCTQERRLDDDALEGRDDQRVGIDEDGDTVGPGSSLLISRFDRHAAAGDR